MCRGLGWRLSDHRTTGHALAAQPGYLLYFTVDESSKDDREPSSRPWETAKVKLAFCGVTQDGDWEGCLYLDRLPYAHEAEAIREVLGIRKRRLMTAEALSNLAPETEEAALGRGLWIRAPECRLEPQKPLIYKAWKATQRKSTDLLRFTAERGASRLYGESLNAPHGPPMINRPMALASWVRHCYWSVPLLSGPYHLILCLIFPDATRVSIKGTVPSSFLITEIK